MSKFLDGCGVAYVHWIPTPARKFPPEVICETPLLAAEAANCNRIRKALLRNSIESWDMLVRAAKQEEFYDWRNYGEKSHERLVAIASDNGYLIESWR